MEPAYISAMFGLGGATVGALASFLTTWMTQRTQFRDKLREAERAGRVELFNNFINEAGRLYGDALTHERDEVGDLVQLYTMVARMELVASSAVVDAARRVIDTVVDTYLAPNRSFRELRDLAHERKLDFLAEFGAACRADLRTTLGALSWANV